MIDGYRIPVNSTRCGMFQSYRVCIDLSVDARHERGSKRLAELKLHTTQLT